MLRSVELAGQSEQLWDRAFAGAAGGRRFSGSRSRHSPIDQRSPGLLERPPSEPRMTGTLDSLTRVSLPDASLEVPGRETTAGPWTNGEAISSRSSIVCSAASAMRRRSCRMRSSGTPAPAIVLLLILMGLAAMNLQLFRMEG